MTLKELVAKLLRNPAAGTKSVVERRVRHWSSSGVLRLTGALFPGQGQAREYDDEAAYVAAALNELAKYGMPLITISAVAHGIYDAIGNRSLLNDDDEAFGDLWDAAKTGAPIALVTVQSPDGRGAKVSIERWDGAVANRNPFFEGCDSFVAVHLRSVFAKLAA